MTRLHEEHGVLAVVSLLRAADGLLERRVVLVSEGGHDKVRKTDDGLTARNTE